MAEQLGRESLRSRVGAEGSPAGMAEASWRWEEEGSTRAWAYAEHRWDPTVQACQWEEGRKLQASQIRSEKQGLEQRVGEFGHYPVSNRHWRLLSKGRWGSGRVGVEGGG